MVRKHRRLEEDQATTTCPLTRPSTHGEEPRRLIHSPFRRCRSISTDCTAMRVLRMQKIGVLADGLSPLKTEAQTETTHSSNHLEADHRTTTCPLIRHSTHGVEQRSLIHSPLRKFRSINMQCTRRIAGASERTEEDLPMESCGVFPCRTRGTSILEAKAAAEATTTCLHTSPSSHGEGRHRLMHTYTVSALETIGLH